MKYLLQITLIVGVLTQAYSQAQAFYNVDDGHGNGIRFWESNNYKIHMGNVAENHYGPVTDYSIKNNMSSNPGRGWTWGISGLTPVAALSNAGNLQIAGAFYSLGSVGIGTVSPAAKLDVQGDAYIGELSQRHYLMISSKEWAEVRFQTPLSDRQIRLGVAHGAYSQYGIDEGDFYVYTQTVNKMPFIVKRNGNITMNTVAGSVGIGTSSPDEKLDVAGNIRVNRMVKVDGHGDVASLQIMDNSNTSTADILLRGDGGASFIKAGLVGIGTTTPDEKLTVKGKIHTEEVRVDLSVPAPDYVFADNYNLPTLESIEKFIKSEKHLPEIPSAKEMEANGVELGTMNMLLLKKIEELTLYQIELMKINEKQQNEIVLQKESYQQLVNRIETLERKR